MTEQELRQIAYETLSVIASKNYSVNGKTYNMRSMVMDMVCRTKLYTPGETIDTYCGLPLKPNYYLVNMTTTGAILSFPQLLNQNIGVLNFASAIKAGGGWLSGKTAQEEDIMRKTTAFLSLLLQDSFYMIHSKNNPIYSDSIIYSPGAFIIRDDDFNFIQPEPINLYTSAALNLTEARKQMIKCDEKIIMYNRIKRIIDCMNHNNEETIVLGAFGCGVFGNNPTTIAKIFRKVLVEEFMEDEFKNIIFAVYDNSPIQQNFNAFKNVFYDKI